MTYLCVMVDDAANTLRQYFISIDALFNRVPLYFILVLCLLTACDMNFRSGWFEDDWETEFRSDLVEPIIARGVECENVRYRRGTKWRDSFLVECSADGENWHDSFLVWPKEGRVRRH